MLRKLRPWLGAVIPVAFMLGLLVMSGALSRTNVISWLCILLHTAILAMYDALQVQWHRPDDMNTAQIMALLANIFASIAWAGIGSSRCFEPDAVPTMLVTLGIMAIQLLIGAAKRNRKCQDDRTDT